MRVPQRMERYAGQPDRVSDLGPFVGKGTWRPEIAFEIRKHQVIIRRFAEAELQAQLELLAAVCAQHVGHNVWQRDFAPA